MVPDFKCCSFAWSIAFWQFWECQFQAWKWFILKRGTIFTHTHSPYQLKIYLFPFSLFPFSHSKINNVYPATIRQNVLRTHKICPCTITHPKYTILINPYRNICNICLLHMNYINYLIGISKCGCMCASM